MSEAPLVSVLMTVYNRERYLSMAIESVLASSFKDFEFIIVDDCSKDRSAEIAKKYESDPRVKVFVNEKNLGDFGNRNKAASLGRGKYLKYVDSDDVIYKHGLQVMVDYIEEFPEAAVALCKRKFHVKPFPILLQPVETYRLHFSNNGLLSNAPTSAIFRAESFRAAGGFMEGYYFGDSEFWLRLAARFPVLLIPEGLTWWRDHGEQENAYQDKDLISHAQYFKCEWDSLRDSGCPLPPEERESAIAWLKGIYLRKLVRLVFKKGPFFVGKLFRTAALKPSDLRYLFYRR